MNVQVSEDSDIEWKNTNFRHFFGLSGLGGYDIRVICGSEFISGPQENRPPGARVFSRTCLPRNRVAERAEKGIV